MGNTPASRLTRVMPLSRILLPMPYALGSQLFHRFIQGRYQPPLGLFLRQFQRGLQPEDAGQGLVQPLRGDHAIGDALFHVPEILLQVAGKQEHIAARGDGLGTTCDGA